MRGIASTSATITGLTNDTYYDIRILSEDASMNKSDWSEVIAQRTLDTTPDAPENTRGAITAEFSLSVMWDISGGVDSPVTVVSYDVRWRLDGTTSWSFANDITDTFYTITDLLNDSSYQVGVRAKSSRGTYSTWSNVSLETFHTSTPPPIPINFEVTQGDGSLPTSWMDGVNVPDIPDIDSYNLSWRRLLYTYPGQSFPTGRPNENHNSRGIWSDGSTMWVADTFDEKLFAYNLQTKARVPSEDFNTLDAAGNYDPRDIWSDGSTMWVSDTFDEKLFAYNLQTKARVPSEDFNLHADNDNPTGIWSDGSTMWVADHIDDKIYAYNLQTKARVPSEDFNTLDAAGNGSPQGIWSDGSTMWVSDTFDEKLFAYNLQTKARVPSEDFNLHANNNDPTGIWSDGSTVWIGDRDDDKIYAYNLQTNARVPSDDFNTLGDGNNDNPTSIWSDGSTMWVAMISMIKFMHITYRQKREYHRMILIH